MKKLNDVIYNKLVLQAEEAKYQNMEKLARAIMGSLSSSPEEEKALYSSSELNDDIHAGLWKLATCIMKFHDLESVDAEKVDATIETLANKFISELQLTLGVDGVVVGPLEPKLPGQE